MRKETERLVRQARRDVQNASKIIATGAYEVTAFLSQQAVEKFLKAVWIEKLRQRPPATHSLRELAEGLGVPAELLPRRTYLNPDYTVDLSMATIVSATVAPAKARWPSPSRRARNPRKMSDRASAFCARTCSGDSRPCPAS